MAQSLASILVHIVFSTKNREPRISPGLQEELSRYLAALCHSRGCPAHRIGGTANHLHLACSLSRTITPATLLEELKANSSRWLKEKDPALVGFHWQAGYGIFSLGRSQLPALVKYIDNQAEHHRQKTFEDEFRDFLHKYEVQYDEQYVWD